MTTIAPKPDNEATCGRGGTQDALKACIGLALPRNAQIAGRYKFLDAAGLLRGDVELDLDWENWGKTCSDDDFDKGKCVSPGTYRVVVERQIEFAREHGVPWGVSASGYWKNDAQLN